MAAYFKFLIKDINSNFKKLRCMSSIKRKKLKVLNEKSEKIVLYKENKFI